MSNRYLIIIALILIVGTVSDGVLYNRPVPSPAIYPLPDPKHIEIAYQDKLLLRLEKIAADSLGHHSTLPRTGKDFAGRTATRFQSADSTQLSGTGFTT